MAKRRVGLWLIGAFGGVGTTVALGLAALRKGLTTDVGLVTALEMLRGLDLDDPGDFVLGGHDVRRASFEQTAWEFQQRSNVFSHELIKCCADDLRTCAENVRPGSVLNSGEIVARLADLPEVQQNETPRAVIERIKADLEEFRERENVAQVCVVNVASTEPPFATTEVHENVARLNSVLEQASDTPVLPCSGLYSLAAIELGLPYVNFTPSLGASFAAAENVARRTGAVLAGKDGKTGETLLKSVLAPMFAHRNLRVLSWVGHNIFGNRDGKVLNDPRNKQSKVKTKDQVISQILGYRPQTHVSIEYIESLDDWKTAWDYIHFEGFLGVKMSLQFTWQGCDSLLAAPLVIDLARMATFAQRRGEVGVLRQLACFFKDPMGVEEQDFFEQTRMLQTYASAHA